MTWTPPAACVRAAWLTLGALTVGLEGPGWFCSSLDLGYPDVRDVVSNRPDQDGIDDRTAYFGARTVTAAITALASAGARIDAVAASFVPFMLPANRPTLHYILDRPGNPERTIKLRPAGYSMPIEGPSERDIQLQWIADDPAALDPVERTSTAWSGSSTAPGRVYNLTFNRLYPPGGGGLVNGHFTSNGDLPVRPRLLIYGPITRPSVVIAQNVAGGAAPWIRAAFAAGFVISAGHYVEVNTARRTAVVDGDPAQSVIASLDWTVSVWGVVPVLTAATLSLAGTSTSGVTQVQALWHDRYLS